MYNSAVDQNEHDRLERKRKIFSERVRHAAMAITGGEDVTYIVCARIRDKQSDKVMTGILTNLGYRDDNNEICPPTLGMMCDVLMEAMLDDPSVGMKKQNVERVVDQYKN